MESKREHLSVRETNRSLIISYLEMRRIIGVLAVGLPFIVVVGGFVRHGIRLQNSISAYYYTNMRDFFVGLICCVALFLISYKGYELIDDVITNLSGLFALGIVAFPASKFTGTVVRVGVFLIPDNVSQYFHLVFSVLFMLLLAFNSIFLFTRHAGVKSREKKKRNAVYITCGIVMAVSVIFMIFYIVFLSRTSISEAKPVFILESIALVSFGISWLVKGHTLFRDKKMG